jgi:hypothetical protein
MLPIAGLGIIKKGFSVEIVGIAFSLESKIISLKRFLLA